MPVEMDNFVSFKTELARKNVLWEDEDFPADSSSLAASDRGSRSIKWMRPGVIFFHTSILMFSLCFHNEKS